MTTTQIVLLVLVLLVVAAVAAALVAQSRKRKRLQSTFGPEYDRTVQNSDKRREAERELAEREQRRKTLDIRPLPAEDRRVFSERWRSTQADFVDQPEEAVRSADVLVTEVMSRRGYPVGDFEQMSRDVSVDHADVVQEYRAAHEISVLNDRKQASTEQLRQAMVHYRALFTDLLSDSDDAGDDSARTHDDRTTSNGMTGGGMTGGGMDHDRVHVDRTSEDRPVTPASGRSDDPGYATTEDHVHTHATDADRTADDRVTSDRAATDGISIDRAPDRTATSRTDGVRVEPGGLHRNHLEDQDRPRA